MKTKTLKTTKLALALSSAFIFCILLVGGLDVKVFGLYMSLYSFYFFIGLIAVLILAIINYFSVNTKFNIFINILALLIVVSFVINVSLNAGSWGSCPSYVDVSLGLFLPALMLTVIFMLDRKFNIKAVANK